MNRQKKPLKLAKETLRALTKLELSDVAGGVVQVTKAAQTCGCPPGNGDTLD